MAADINGRVVSSGECDLSFCAFSQNSFNLNTQNCATDAEQSQQEIFREYSPQNNSIIRAVIEPNTHHTPHSSINNAQIEFHSQSDQLSQEFIPNQDFIVNLDRKLDNLPKDSYISKLIELTNDSENTIKWYRTILLIGANSIPGCQKGKLFNRKSTNKSPAAQKYAKDCYMLYMYIHGDNYGLDEVFRKDDTKSVSESRPIPEINVVELRATLHSALERLSQLEKSDKENEKTIKELKSENVKLKHELADIKEKLEARVANCERKFTQIESSNKIITRQYQALGEFNFESYVASIKKFESEIERHNKKGISELKQLSQKSYAEKLTQYVPTRSPEIINNKQSVSSANTCIPSEVVTRSTEAMIKTIEPDSNYGTVIDSPVSTKHLNDKDYIERPIPMRVGGVTSEAKATSESDDDSFFQGVTIRKLARYYLSGINPKSTRSGIVSYLEKRDVHVTYLRLFKPSNRSVRHLTAKLNVTEGCAETVESGSIWPEGVRCRKWYSNNEWIQRWTEEKDNGSAHDSNFNHD